MTTYAEQRRKQYEHDMGMANTVFRNTGNLAEYQKLAKYAKDMWLSDIRKHYNNDTINAELLNALSSGGRIYATLETGETVRVHGIDNLYHVTDITGAPAEPLISRMTGGFTVKHTTLNDLVSRA